jgi:tetratricopeptide (TPR) repeat protein
MDPRGEDAMNGRHGRTMLVLAMLAAGCRQATPVATEKEIPATEEETLATEGEILAYKPVQETGFIFDWLLSFKHTYPHVYVGASMEYDALQDIGGEKDIRPVAGMTAGTGRPWAEFHGEQRGWRGVVEFPAAAMTITYAFAYIHCEEELRDLTLLTGSDDALLVLLNGEQVQKVQIQRGYNNDQDRMDGVVLKKGWNTLLCKVDDYMGGHGLAVRFKTKDGEPLTDYVISMTPPAAGGGEPKFVDGKTYEAEADKMLKTAMQIATEKGDHAAAAVACEEVVERYSKSEAAAQALYRAGSYLEKLDRADEALVRYKRLIGRYPFAKWAEDGLLAEAELLEGRGDAAGASSALRRLLADYGSSSLVAEAMLKLAGHEAATGDFDASDPILKDVRERFKSTVESVQALEMLADNLQARKDGKAAKGLWKQVMAEAKGLSEGKYVWYVNVQVMLQDISGRCRDKIAGKAPEAR